MAKYIEPNREMELKSAITGLQIAFDEYKAALFDYYSWMGYNDNGEFFTHAGHEIRWKKLCECDAAVTRMRKVVEGLKAMMMDAEVKE